MKTGVVRNVFWCVFDIIFSLFRASQYVCLCSIFRLNACEFVCVSAYLLAWLSVHVSALLMTFQCVMSWHGMAWHVFSCCVMFRCAILCHLMAFYICMCVMAPAWLRKFECQPGSFNFLFGSFFMFALTELFLNTLNRHAKEPCLISLIEVMSLKTSFFISH